MCIHPSSSLLDNFHQILHCVADPKLNYISFSGHSTIDVIIRSKKVIIKIQSCLTRYFLKCHFDNWKSDIVIREKSDKNVEANNCSTFLVGKKVGAMWKRWWHSDWFLAKFHEIISDWSWSCPESKSRKFHTFSSINET